MYKITTYIKENDQMISSYTAQSDYIWTEHLLYTRNAIISIANKLPDSDAVVNRLVLVQDQLGSLLSPYYNATDVTSLVDLFREHVRLVGNLALNDPLDTTEYAELLYENGMSISNLMYNMNPYYWSKAVTWPLWQAHINLVATQIKARQEGLWSDDIAACNKNHDTIVDFSKVFSRGTVYKNLEMFSDPLLS